MADRLHRVGRVCIVLPEVAGVFIDGRYRTQVKAQVDLGAFTPVPWPEVKPGTGSASICQKALSDSTRGCIAPMKWRGSRLRFKDRAFPCAPSPIAENRLRIWPDQPAAPTGAAFPHPDALAGETSRRQAQPAGGKPSQGRSVGGGDDPARLPLLALESCAGPMCRSNPILHGFAILRDDGAVDAFIAPAKLNDPARTGAGCGRAHFTRPTEFAPALKALSGASGRVDRGIRAAWPCRVWCDEGGATVGWGDDPCRLPKACKNAAEIAGTREAHLRDGAAMVEFLCWLDDAKLAFGRADRD
jgi:Xaa-Pro aminopeptidase